MFQGAGEDGDLLAQSPVARPVVAVMDSTALDLLAQGASQRSRALVQVSDGWISTPHHLHPAVCFL